MNPNVTDFQQKLKIENQSYYYLAEHADLFKTRLKNDANEPQWLVASETTSPATKRANIAFFRNLSNPDMNIVFDSIGTNSGISGYQIISNELNTDVASTPSPSSRDKTQGGAPVPLDTVLTWSAPKNYTPASYSIYVGEYGDPNWALTPDATGLTTASFDPELAYGKTYVWRVDSYEGATVHKGDLWYFDVQGDPVITVQPHSVSVQAGSDTFFDVAALVMEGLGGVYNWYRSTDAVTNTPADDVLLQTGTSPRVDILDVDTADVAYYYVVLTNTIPGSAAVTSQVASLAIGKLEVYLPFDGDPNDASGNGWNAVPGNRDSNGLPTMGTISYQPGYEGDPNTAAKFTRDSGDQLEILGSDTYFNFYPKGFTVRFWVKPTSYGTVNGFMTYVAKGNTSTGTWRMFDTAFYYGQGFEAAIYPLGANTPPGRLDDGQWHLLAATYDAATQQMKIYQNGYLQNTLTGAVDTPISYPVTIGSYDRTGTGGWGYDGLIDEVEIFSYAIDEYAMLEDYAIKVGLELCLAPIAGDINDDCKVDLYDVADLAPQWLDSTNPGTAPMTRVVHWNFDETSGLTATDSSGNGIHGTLGANFAGDGNAQWVVNGGRTGNVGDNALYIDGDPNTAVIATVANPNSLANGADNVFLGTASWTMNLWVKMTGSQAMSVNIGGFGQNEWLDPSVNSDRYFAAYGDYAGYEVELGQDGLFPSQVLNTGEWKMLTATYDGTTCRVYLNGEQVEMQEVALVDTYVNEINLNTARRVLWDAGAQPMMGYLDDFSIWSEAFGPTQVMGMYTNDFPSCDGVLPADTNGDCEVDLADLEVIAVNWLECNRVPSSLCN